VTPLTFPNVHRHRESGAILGGHSIKPECPTISFLSVSDNSAISELSRTTPLCQGSCRLDLMT